MISKFKMEAARSRGHRALLLALLLSAPAPVLAQVAAGGPAVQAQPSRESLQLNTALSRLARNPRDIEALVEAGNAASTMGDFEAAIGFFKRGQQMAANDPRVLAGLAGALVQHADPAGAIPLFERAERAGAKAETIAGNRGLAYDLVGDPATAQRYYQAALTSGDNDEIVRRLAVSYAISGDEKAMERTILPLLKKQDKAAWRSRAFSYAILGKTGEAIKITRTLLPARIADSIAPYLEYMPRLTAAQQASAANLGVFPRASEIGRDGTAVAAFSGGKAAPAGVASVDKALVPAGKPLGGEPGAQVAMRPARPDDRVRQDARRTAPPEPRPSRETAPADGPAFAAAPPAATPRVAEILSAAPAGRTTPAAAAPVVAAGKPQAAMPAAPVAANPAGLLASAPVVLAAAPTEPLPATPTPAPAATTAAAPARAPVAPQPSFADMFGDLGRPETVSAPAAGAVDIRKIAPTRPAKPKVEAKPVTPPPPSHPSRIWVQVAVGQKLPALATDWKRLEKTAPDAFKGIKPNSTRMNQTNRLLAGPFATQKQANAFVAALDKAGIDGPYVWTSPAGQVVDALAR